MDPDIELVWGLFRHIYPEFTCNHVYVYKLLWRIEPISPEVVIEKSKLARATVYKVLNDLISAGLVKKTSFKPVCYFAENPLKVYTAHCQKIFQKLKKGREKIGRLINNSSGLSGELYLIQQDGGQMRLINKQNHQTILDEFALREYKKIIEAQIVEAEKKKLKPWMIYR